MGGADASGTFIGVRGVEPGDAAAVAALLDALGYPCSEAEATERLEHFREDPRQFLLLALSNGTPCGLVAMKLNYSLTRGADVARITALVVSPDAHGQGIGRRLLGRSRRWPVAIGRCAWKSPAILRVPGRTPSTTRAAIATARATSRNRLATEPFFRLLRSLPAKRRPRRPSPTQEQRVGEDLRERRSSGYLS